MSAARILAHAQAHRSRLMYALIQNGTITQVAAGPPSKAQEAAYVASWLGTLAASWALLTIARALTAASKETP